MGVVLKTTPYNYLNNSKYGIQHLAVKQRSTLTNGKKIAFLIKYLHCRGDLDKVTFTALEDLDIDPRQCVEFHNSQNLRGIDLHSIGQDSVLTAILKKPFFKKKNNPVMMM